MRPALTAALLPWLLTLASLPTSAQEAGPKPAVDALDFAPIDILTIDFGLGAIDGFDAHDASVDVRLGLLGASLDALGIGARILQFDADIRPGIATTTLGGTLLSLDAWMVGASISDSSPCLWWPAVLCDGSTGFVGFGGSLLGVVYDSATTRSAIRLVQIDGLASATPAFGAAWSKYRFLPRLGASLDYLSHAPGFGNGWLTRLSVGFDAAARLGPLEFQPVFRWRPSFSSFSQDWGIETVVNVGLRTQWAGFSSAGESLRIALQFGYQYWRLPGTAYSIDQIVAARSTGFVRVVISPSLFSAVPP
jgi:hypothetical protein